MRCLFIREVFDTGCSHSLSNVPGRISSAQPLLGSVSVAGYNGSRTAPDTRGINGDGKKEYYFSNQQKRLVLLCANDYVQGGAAVLFPNGGTVYSLTEYEREQLESFLYNFM